MRYGGTIHTSEADDREAVRVFSRLAQRVRRVNEANGWYDENRTVSDGVALLHSEVSEAFDAWRKHGFDDVVECHPTPGETVIATVDDGKLRLDHKHTELCKPQSYGSELADVLIRVLDQADRDGVDLLAEFERKLAYNATRGYRHGGRRV